MLLPPHLQDLVAGRADVATGGCGRVANEGAGLRGHVMSGASWSHVRRGRLAARPRQSVTLVRIPLPRLVVTIVTLGRVGGAADGGVEPGVVVTTVMVSTATAPPGAAAASHAGD